MVLENNNTEPDTIVVLNYEFRFIQTLQPKCDTEGRVIKYRPQERFLNPKNLPLSIHGKGEFCKFTIKAEEKPGVYLWLIDGKIIYIGETFNFKRRFNMGYGLISPRKCYKNGQSTNCKMNKVVLESYEQEKSISLYFLETPDYKAIERELLATYKTKYNGRR